MDNQLAVIIKESGLESTKAANILKTFQDFFQIAAEWEVKAKAIVVTDASQKAEMQMARIGRLFLRDHRLLIEKNRKEMKEQLLRDGKAIDGISNVLKMLFIPLEEYLDRQEHFVEIKAKEAERLRVLEAERKAEEKRIAQEKAEAEERERIRLENERLRKEAEEKEKALVIERAKVESEKKATEEKLQKEREEADRFRKIEQEKHAKTLAEQRAKAEREKKALQEKLARQIECPFCHKKFTLPR